MSDVVEVALKINVNDSGEPSHQPVHDSIQRLVRCPFGPVRKRTRVKISFKDRLQDELHPPPGLDGRKTLSIDPWRSVVGLRRLIRRSERLQFTHVNVETPKPPRLLGFRLTVYPSPQFLQINGRFYHASPASPRGRSNQTQHGP